MPAKSQFGEIKFVDQGNLLSVGGKTGGDADASTLPTTHLFAAILQDGNVVELTGTAGPPHPTTWTLTEPRNGINAGPAQAFGLAVQFEDVTNGSAFETFAWMQNVDVKSN